MFFYLDCSSLGCCSALHLRIIHIRRTNWRGDGGVEGSGAGHVRVSVVEVTAFFGSMYFTISHDGKDTWNLPVDRATTRPFGSQTAHFVHPVVTSNQMPGRAVEVMETLLIH